MSDLALASRSPRRIELLRQIGVHPRVIDVVVDETPVVGEPAAALAMRLACAKALAGRGALGDEPVPVLAADTVVALGGRVFGKPVDSADAIRMLRALSGRRHEVFSAVAVAGPRSLDAALSRSEVSFARLDASAIERYVATGEPLDKAGAYAIQGLAAGFVRRLAGSYSGVMGLPLYETARLLRAFGVEPLG
ncbi:MAG: septum formation inhibitor Maf [Chromatiales bacterium]|nr:septum formation inhibitor Maf [Chromatiales bacterium]